MGTLVLICLAFSLCINENYGRISLLQSKISDKNGLMPSTVTDRVSNMLRDILKRESMERLSTIQKILNLEKKDKKIEAENAKLKKELIRMNETFQEFRKNNDVHLLETALRVLNESSMQWTDMSKLLYDRTGNFNNCWDFLRKYPGLQGIDGIYEITIAYKTKFVYCDMTTEGGGWTAIQRRQDNSTDFYRTWYEYKHGFGDPSTNYWIGNDAIYELTKNKDQELRVELQSFDGAEGYAEYSTFYVGDENSKYVLTLTGYSGTAGDSLDNGSKFTTKDDDNDNFRIGGCGALWHGAWWYNNCGNSNLNGEYGQSGDSGGRYVAWYHWKKWEALKQTVLMIRQKT